jgi:pyridoxal phosphate-dependent aminotransferase EpsN
MSGDSVKPILLSPPHIGAEESQLVQQAIDSNWIAPTGAFVDQFEAEFARVVGIRHAVAVASGTAALHLALHTLGIGSGDEVAVSTLTFVGSVAPIVHRHAAPVFIDSDQSWNMDPGLLREALRRHPRIRAVIAVHLYGHPADLDAIREVCEERGVTLIEDAAEALGTTYKDRHVGRDGRISFFSFNGNKIITTSSGGMLVTDDESIAAHVRKLSAQAREPVLHYEHVELGYNFRLSNILAALGVAQLRRLSDRVALRRRNFAFYQQHLAALPGVTFMPESRHGRGTRWLTTLTIDPELSGVDATTVQRRLAQEQIESRPVWKPMHQQPALKDYPVFSTGVADSLYRDGLCLPSGSSLTEHDLERIVGLFRALWTTAGIVS